MSRLLGRIGDWVAGIRPDTFDARTHHAARRLIVDQLAIAIGGRARGAHHPVHALASSVGSRGRATVWSTRLTTSMAGAALVNRADADALELVAGPECVAAAVAVAEHRDRTFGDLTTAVAIGAEVDEYFRAWQLAALERHGLHPPAFVGALGATAAAGWLLGLAPREMGGALGAASALCPQSPFVAFTAGASGKTLYGAWSQMLGVQAAEWSRVGITGAPDAWEGARGIGPALADVAGAIEPPPFEPSGRAVGRVMFKAFPCSRSAHPALTALEALGPIDPERVRQVDVATYPYAVTVSSRSDGRTRIAAQASIPHVLALAMLHGDLIDALTDTNVGAPAVRELADRVAVRIHPGIPTDGPRVRRARVTITMFDGTTLEAERSARWSAEQPATDEELLARAATLTSDARPRHLWGASPETLVRTLVGGARPALNESAVPPHAHG